jgi:UDP-2-acetamido-3-amino-2,3-dideoxy-glucuronate N-acetyltransferase
MDKPYIINFNTHADDRGKLVALEEGQELPFRLQRVYYMRDLSENKPRGYHAHRNLQQLAICLSGSCNFLLDNGQQKFDFRLSSPDEGLYIGKYMWREMHHLSHDCILLVLASEKYSPSDYIDDYDEFIKEVDARAE